MALIIVKRSEPVAVPVHAPMEGGFSWSKWYDQNKQRLSEKRAKRYREDPAYRQAALQRSKTQRETKKQPVVDGHTLSFSDMADQLGVTVWVLREWRRKDYFPEPFHREGRLWFKPSQEVLLQRLQQYFLEHGIRVTEGKRQSLSDVVSLCYANW